jgi:hypothetical protein
MSTICAAIRYVQSLLHTEMRRRKIWEDTVFQGLYIVPILGQVLAMRRQSIDDVEERNAILELFRLAAVLYISALRTPFGVDTISTEPLYAAKLHSALISYSLVEGISSLVLVWVLSVAFTSNCEIDRKHCFKRELIGLLVTLDIANFQTLKETLTAVVWDEDLLASQSQCLQELFLSDW